MKQLIARLLGAPALVAGLALAAFRVASPTFAQEPTGQVRILEGQPAGVYAVRVAPDGKTAATAAADGTVTVWDTATNQIVRSIPAHTGPALSLAISRDGKWLASGGLDRKINLYDLPTGYPLISAAGVPGVPLALDASTDGKLALTIDQGRVLRLWDLTTGAAIRDYGGITAEPVGAFLVGPLKQVISGAQDGSLRGWNIDNAQPVGSVLTAPIASLAYRAKDHLVALGGNDGMLRIVAWPAVAPVNLAGHGDQVTAVAIADHGKFVLSGSNDQVVQLTAVADNKQLRALPGVGGPVTSVALNTEAVLAAAGNSTGTIKFWSTADGVDKLTLAGHTGPVAALAFQPKGKLIASAGADGTLRLWNMPTANVPLAGHTAVVQSVAVNNDGKLLATASADKTVKLWNPADGKLIRSLPPQAQSVQRVAVAPGGEQLATGDGLGTVRIVAAKDGAEQGVAEGHTAPITGLFFRAGGKQLISSADDGTVRFWNLPLTSLKPLPLPTATTPKVALGDGRLIVAGGGDGSAAAVDPETGAEKQKFAPAAAPLTALALSADGKLLVGTTNAGGLKAWDAAAGTDLGIAAGHEGAITSLAINPTIAQIATGGVDGTVRLWRQPTAVRSLAHHAKPITTVATSGDGKVAASAAEDMTVQIWNLAEGKPSVALPKQIAQVVALAVSTDGKLVATGDATGMVRVWNAADAAPLAAWGAHTAAVSSLKFDAAGTQLVSGGADGSVGLWKIPTAAARMLQEREPPTTIVAASHDGKLLAVASADKSFAVLEVAGGKPKFSKDKLPNQPTSLAFSADGALLAVGNDGGKVILYKTADGTEAGTFADHKGAVSAVAFDPKSGKIATGGVDGALRLWGVEQPERKQAWTIPAAAGGVLSLVFTPDGATLVTAGADKKVQSWNAADGKLVRTFAGPTDVPTQLALSADGTKLAASGVDKAARVWNMADGALVATLPHAGPVRAVRFNGDASRLATGADDNTVRIWSLPTGRLLERHVEATKPITGIAFATDNQSVHFAAADGKVRSVPLAVTFNEPLHAAGAVHVGLSPDGKQVVSGGADKLVKLTDQAGKPIAQMTDATAPIRSVAVRADGAQLAASSDDAHVYFWRLDNRQLEKKVPLGAAVSHLSYSSDKLRLLAAHADARLRIIHVGEFRPWEEVVAPAALRGAAFVDATTVIVGGADNKLHVHALAGTGLLTGHTGAVQGLAFSADGKTLASAGADKNVRHWNPAEGKLVRALTGPADAVTAVTVSADNVKIIAASADRTIRSWNVSDGGAAPAVITATTPVRGLISAGDASRVASYGDDQIVRLWDLTSGKELQRFTGHKAPITGLAAAADGKRLVSVSADKTIGRWPVAAERVIVADAAKIHDLAPVGDGTTFVTGGEDKLVKLWDGEGKLVRQIGGASHAVRSIAVSTDGKRVAAGGDPSLALPTVWVWELADAKHVQTITTPVGVSQLAYDHDTKLIVAGADKHTRIYSVADNRLLEDLTTPGVLLDVALLPGDARRLAAGGNDNSAYLLTPALVRAWTAHVGGATSLAFTADGAQLISGGNDKLVAAWNTADGKKVASYGGHAAGVTSVALSPDGEKIAAGGGDKTIKFWARTAKSESADTPIAHGSFIAYPAGVRTVAFSADGKQLVAGGDDNTVWSYDIDTGKEREHWTGHGGAILSVALSPDGKSLYSGSVDRTLRRWTPSVVGIGATGLEGAVGSTALAPDAKLAFAAGAKGAVVAIDTESFAVVRKFAGAQLGVKSLGVSRDGKFLAAGTDDAKLYVWKTEAEPLVAVAELAGPARSLAVGAEAKKLIVATGDKVVRNYSLIETGGKLELQLIQQGHGHTDGVAAVALVDDDKTMLSVSLDRTVKRWPAARGSALHTFDKDLAAVYGLDFSLNGKLLGAACGDKTARLLKTDTFEQAASCGGHPGQVTAIAFRSNEQFATISSGGATNIWGIDGMPVHQRTDPQLGNLRALGISSDGNILALGGTSRAVQLRDVANQTLVQTLLGHNGTIVQAAYSPTAARLATLDETGQVFVWDPSAGTLLYHQQLPLGVAYSLTYTPDGKEWLVGGSAAKLLRVQIPVHAQ